MLIPRLSGCWKESEAKASSSLHLNFRGLKAPAHPIHPPGEDVLTFHRELVIPTKQSQREPGAEKSEICTHSPSRMSWDLQAPELQTRIGEALASGS